MLRFTGIKRKPTRVPSLAMSIREHINKTLEMVEEFDDSSDSDLEWLLESKQPPVKKHKGGKTGRHQKLPTFMANGNAEGLRRHEWLLNHAGAKEFRRILRMDRPTFDFIVERLCTPKKLLETAFKIFCHEQKANSTDEGHNEEDNNDQLKLVSSVFFITIYTNLVLFYTNLVLFILVYLGMGGFRRIRSVSYIYICLNTYLGP